MAAVVSVKLPEDRYDRFLRRLGDRVAEIVRREGHGVARLWIEPLRDGYRFVRMWLNGVPEPLTWNQEY